jgi:hypothetical protein
VRHEESRRQNGARIEGKVARVNGDRAQMEEDDFNIDLDVDLDEHLGVDYDMGIEWEVNGSLETETQQHPYVLRSPFLVLQIDSLESTHLMRHEGVSHSASQ